MQITYICDEYPPKIHGGIGTFTKVLAAEVAERGHEVTVVGIGNEDKVWRDGKVTVHELRPKLRIKGLNWLMRRITRRTWLKKHVGGKDSIIEVPDHMGELPFGVAKGRVVVRLHLAMATIMERERGHANPLIKWLERRNLAVNRNWIAVSRHAIGLTRETFGLEAGNAAVIYCPIEAPLSTSVPVNDLPVKFVLFAGTVNRRKGAFTVASAANQWMDANGDIDLVYAGRIGEENDVPVKDLLLNLIDSKHHPRVKFLGPIDRRVLFAIMARSVAFALPSELETFGLVVGEAMLSGVPVIVTKRPPFDEFVREGETGFMVDPNDHEAIAHAVLWISDNSEQAKRMGSLGRLEIERRFNLGYCVEQTLTFYKHILNDAAGSAADLSLGGHE